jgi:hypothetical protein
MIARDYQTTRSRHFTFLQPVDGANKACAMLRWIAVGTIVCGWVSATTAPALAQENWGAKMLDRPMVDFGSVAKGADARQRLKIRNVYQEMIQITSVTTSCACFKATLAESAKQIPSGQTVELELTINTLNYQQKRDATLTLSFYEPTKRISTDVRVPLQGYIRTDVVFTPGSINFGNVDVGVGSQQLVRVAYAGRPDWRIVDVKSSNPNVVSEIKETSRGNGLVNYDLMVQLKSNTPAGTLRDQLTLITDDKDRNPQVPLLVYGMVESEITITPETLAYSPLNPGETETKFLIVRAKKPIVIEKIEREKGDDSFRMKKPDDAKLIHKLPITLVAPSEPGSFNELFTITIAGRAEPLTFHVQGQIKAPPPASSSAN